MTEFMVTVKGSKYIFTWHDKLKTLTVLGPVSDAGAVGPVFDVKSEKLEAAIEEAQLRILSGK